jgi:hypothetical protein
VIGIDAGDERGCLQQGCRELVKQLIAGASDYYLISFSEDRVAATREAVQALARRCGFTSQASQRINELCSARVKRHEKQATAWTFTIVSDELQHDQQLDAATREVLLRAHERFAVDSETLKQRCAESPTAWDVYTRQLTPDIPHTLSDFVSVGLATEAQLDFILQRLDSDQRSVLLTRYRVTAMRVTSLSESELPDSW